MANWPRYKVQKGRLSGGYKDYFETRNSQQAWAVFWAVPLEPGRVKRLLEDGRVLKRLSGGTAT